MFHSFFFPLDMHGHSCWYIYEINAKSEPTGDTCSTHKFHIAQPYTRRHCFRRTIGQREVIRLVAFKHTCHVTDRARTPSGLLLR